MFSRVVSFQAGDVRMGTTVKDYEGNVGHPLYRHLACVRKPQVAPFVDGSEVYDSILVHILQLNLLDHPPSDPVLLYRLPCTLFYFLGMGES